MGQLDVRTVMPTVSVPRTHRGCRRGLLVSASATVLLMAGCGSTKEEVAEEAFNFQNGPMAKLMGYDISPAEQRERELNVQQGVVECMKDEGWEYEAVDYSASNPYQDEYEEQMADPVAYGEKYGYGVVRNYELYEEPNIGEDDGLDGPTFVDPNEDYVMSLSDSERDAYYEVLYGAPQEEQIYDESTPEGTQAEYLSPPLEEQGCQGTARLDVVGEDPTNDPEIQRALDDVFSAQQNDPRMETAENDWLDCMGDVTADHDLPDGTALDGVGSMYQIVESLKAAAMGQEMVPLDPDTGMPIGDYDESDMNSSFQNEDGTGYAVLGEQKIIPEDALERLRADELALWAKDWGCQKDAGIQDLRIQVEQDAVDDLVARFPQLGDAG